MIPRLSLTLPHPMVLYTFVISVVGLHYVNPSLMIDNDFPWHVAVGDLIRELGAIPKTDPWSFTAGGVPWYNLAWLWNIFISFSMEYAGLVHTRSFTILIGALTIALLMRNLLERGYSAEEGLILTMLMIGMAMSAFLNGRPQLISFPLVLIAHHLLHKSRDSQSYGRLFWLPVIGVFWANVHGSVIVLGILIGAYGLEAMLARRWDWFTRLFAIGAACALTILLLNPYGLHLIDALVRAMDSVAQDFIMEWQPYRITDSFGAALWLMVLLLVMDFKNRAVPFADRFLAYFWLLQMFFSYRNASMAVLLSAPFLLYHMHQLAYRISKVSQTKPIMYNSAPVRQSVAAGMIALTGTIAVLFTPLHYLMRPQAELVAQLYTAADVLAYVEQHYPDGRFLNEYGAGGFHIYEGRGRVPLFVDGRAGIAYPEEVLQEYFDFRTAKPGWDRVFTKYNLTGMIIPKNTFFTDLYASDYQRQRLEKVYEGEDAIVYIVKGK